MAKQKTKTTSNDRLYDDVDSLISNLEKKHGKGIIMSENVVIKNVKFIPTGILGLDCALGGGLPSGRMIEIFGPESGGKTSLCLHCIGIAQRLGRTAGFIDAEHAYDKNYANAFRVDTNKVLLNQPDSAEQGLEVAQEMIGSGLVNLVVIDSVAALVPQAEVEAEMGASHMGLQARLISQACRKLASIIGKTDCTLIWINQIRMKIGVMFGNPETTTGGNALKFYSSQRIDVRKIERIPKEKDAIATGMRQRCRVVKNKVAPPFRSCELDMYFNRGYDTTADLVTMAVDFDIIQRNGAWYSYDDERLGQGLDSTIDTIKRLDKEVRKELRRKVKQSYLNQK